MKILVVDDSRAARMLITSILREYDGGAVIFEAENGQEGVKLFTSCDPDITFLDLTMPVMDGYEALKQIKSINSKAVVIVLTADIQEKAQQKCMNAGAYTVMKKLPRKEIVHDVIDQIIKEQKNQG